MRKLKDFFYDKNDIIIVLIIIAVAAFIIYTRVEAIMDYPEQYAKEIEATATKEKTTTAAETTETTEETTEEILSITIDDSDYSTDVSEKLAEAGLVSSAEEFDSFINESGKSNSIQSGTFQIPSGATFEEILEIIT